MTRPLGTMKDAHRGVARCLSALALALALMLAPIAGAAAAEKESAAGGAADAVAATEDHGTGDPPAVVKVHRLNIRAGPGAQFRILRTVARGDELPLLAIEDGWAKFDTGPVGWALARYLRVPEHFGIDPFVVREDAFLGWAVGIEFLEEISLHDEGSIWVVLTPEGYARPDRPIEIARKLACGYRERTGFGGTARVTVWSADGPGDRQVTEQRCDG